MFASSSMADVKKDQKSTTSTLNPAAFTQETIDVTSAGTHSNSTQPGKNILIHAGDRIHVINKNTLTETTVINNIQWGMYQPAISGTKDNKYVVAAHSNGEQTIADLEHNTIRTLHTPISNDLKTEISEKRDYYLVQVCNFNLVMAGNHFATIHHSYGRSKHSDEDFGPDLTKADERIMCLWSVDQKETLPLQIQDLNDPKYRFAHLLPFNDEHFFLTNINSANSYYSELRNVKQIDKPIFTIHHDVKCCVAFADGKHFLAGKIDDYYASKHSISYYDMTKPEPIATFNIDNKCPSEIVILPDQKHFAAHYGNTVCIWNVDKPEKPVLELPVKNKDLDIKMFLREDGKLAFVTRNYNDPKCFLELIDLKMLFRQLPNIPVMWATPIIAVDNKAAGQPQKQPVPTLFTAPKTTTEVGSMAQKYQDREDKGGISVSPIDPSDPSKGSLMKFRFN